MQKRRYRPEAEMSLLRRIEEVGVQRGDFEVLTPEEVQTRIRERLDYQDTVLVPTRIEEGHLTPEWRRYVQRRQEATHPRQRI